MCAGAGLFNSHRCGWMVCIKQVEYQIKLQHQSTCLQARPPKLPINFLPKPPVGLSHFLFSSPMAGQMSWIMTVRRPFLRRPGSDWRRNTGTGTGESHWSHPPTFRHRPHFHFTACKGMCVCMCVCVTYVLSTLFMFRTIPVLEYLRLTITFAIPDIRQLQCLPYYTPTAGHNCAQLFYLLLYCPH